MKNAFPFLMVLLARIAFADAPSKEECNTIFKKEKAAMNTCVESKCRGMDQQRFQECHSGCALDRSQKYQACYAKYVLEM